MPQRDDRDDRDSAAIIDEAKQVLLHLYPVVCSDQKLALCLINKVNCSRNTCSCIGFSGVVVGGAWVTRARTRNSQ